MHRQLSKHITKQPELEQIHCFVFSSFSIGGRFVSVFSFSGNVFCSFSLAVFVLFFLSVSFAFPVVN